MYGHIKRQENVPTNLTVACLLCATLYFNGMNHRGGKYTYDRCDSQSESHTEGCTTHVCLVQQVCSVLLHQFPHQVKVTTYCCQQNSCPAIL